MLHAPSQRARCCPSLCVRVCMCVLTVRNVAIFLMLSSYEPTSPAAPRGAPVFLPLFLFRYLRGKGEGRGCTEEHSISRLWHVTPRHTCTAVLHCAALHCLCACI